MEVSSNSGVERKRLCASHLFRSQRLLVAFACRTLGFANTEAAPEIEHRRPDLPTDPSRQLPNPIDRWVQIYLRQQGFPFPEPVADSVFVRRAYLDLWGLLPSPQEPELPTGWKGLSRFVYRYALGRSPAAAELEVARLLLRDSGTEKEIGSEGLEDLLWSVFVSPEFQFIH